jgi:hypothetical protein
VGRLWRSHGGRRRAGRGEAERGVLGAFLFFPPLLTARVGAEGAGIDRGVINEYGYRHETNGSSDLHSNHDFRNFCLPGVRSNARKKFNFKFLKMATVGLQQIGQGFQEYFCYKERLSFAEIKFQILVLSLFQIQSLAEV